MKSCIFGVCGVVLVDLLSFGLFIIWHEQYEALHRFLELIGDPWSEGFALLLGYVITTILCAFFVVRIVKHIFLANYKSGRVMLIGAIGFRLALLAALLIVREG